MQDVISDIDKQLDENRYAQAVEVLAEKIAENLSRKIPMQREILQEEHTRQEPDTALLPEQSDEAVDTSNEEHVPINDTAPVHENVRVDDDNIQVIETQEEAVLGNEKNKISEPEIDNNPVEEIVDKALDGAATEEINKDESLNGQSPAAQENDSEIIVDSDEDLFPEDIANDDVIESESSENQTPFILDQEQQNLLWCHAKHQVKGSPSFEQYLNTTDPEQLAQLFLYLRDLFAYLPQGELEIFLNSSERIQIYYIIARLSGELGLKERANLIQQACTVVNAQSPYNNMAVFKLLSYLRDLSIALPDQELGTRVRQELEQLMANMSSVLPDL